ncbi:alpha/beta fold hydrolase [Streptosporangiaceae bacterium NEAU-GS5]|nr:alpha/beta fold hydrolase [Streptosporangiaceae bacterium NEAU-GS5]
MTDTLQAPGATLYYEVRGSGPALLLICGGVYDADGFTALADRLADRRTVITYDRRGNSRSPLDGPPQPQEIEVHADDAARVLSAVAGDGPADVFGNSSGAMIGLALATRHPQRVRTLVAHEPPLFTLLPDYERHWHDVLQNIEDTFHKEGWAAASAVLTAAFGPEEPQGLGPQEEPAPEVMRRMMGNMEFFIGYEVPPFGRYVPDLAALAAAPVIAGIGADSAGEVQHTTTLALAERLGLDPLVFPGAHGGFGTHVDAFAATLEKAL